MTIKQLFDELVQRHGEENGGIEDFSLQYDGSIAGRYSEICIRQEADGWHYGPVTIGYPTPSLAYEHSREDMAAWYKQTEPATTEAEG